MKELRRLLRLSLCAILLFSVFEQLPDGFNFRADEIWAARHKTTSVKDLQTHSFSYLYVLILHKQMITM